MANGCANGAKNLGGPTKVGRNVSIDNDCRFIDRIVKLAIIDEPFKMLEIFL